MVTVLNYVQGISILSPWLYAPWAKHGTKLISLVWGDYGKCVVVVLQLFIIVISQN